MVLRSTGKPNEAIGVFRSGLRSPSEQRLAPLGLGDALAAAAGEVEALPEFRQAVAMEPEGSPSPRRA